MAGATLAVQPGPAAIAEAKRKAKEPEVPQYSDKRVGPTKANPLGLSEMELRELGITICSEIDASQTGQGSLPKRWRRNKDLYDLDPNATNQVMIEGRESYTLPLWKPKADKLIETVLGTLTAGNSYVQISPRSEKLEDKEKTDRLEKALQTLATTDVGVYGFDSAFRGALKIAVNTCIAFLYVYVTEDGENKGEIKFEYIDPNDFCVYRHELGDLSRATTIGHKFPLCKWEVTERFLADRYITDDVVGEDDFTERGSQNATFAGTSPTPPYRPLDNLLECWQIVRKCDLGKFDIPRDDDSGITDHYEGMRDYVFVVAKQSQRVLRVEPLIYKKSRRYFAIQFDRDYGSIWPANSPGQEMQALQVIHSDSINALLQGSWLNALGAVLLSGMTPKDKVTQILPGMVIDTPNENAKAQPLMMPFNGQWLLELLPVINQMADVQSRVSPIGQGVPPPSHTTATAAAGMLRAQEQGQGAYARFIAPAVAQVWQFLAELLELHYRDILDFYGDLGLKDATDLTVKAKYVTTGQGAGTNPQARQQALAMLLTMALQPKSRLDYQKCEKQAVENAELGFDTVGLFQPPGVTLQDLVMVGEGLIAGKVSPQEFEKILQEAAQELGLPPPTPPDTEGRNHGQPPDAEQEQSSQAGGATASPLAGLPGPFANGALAGAASQ